MEHTLPDDLQQYYIADNVMEGHPEYNPDNWKNGGIKDPQGHAAMMKLEEPFCPSYITEQSAKDAYETVMADVGANYPKLDAIDARTIKDVLRRGFTYKGSKTGLPGIPDSVKDVGGYKDLKGGEAPADRDHDGMPDAYEQANHLNPDDATDGNKDAIGDGYTNLERYLNAIPTSAKQEQRSARRD
jgi:pectate lyase